MRACILLASGLWANPLGGIFQISQTLRGGYTNPEDVWIQYCKHSDDAQNFANIVYELSPEFVIHVGHSLGVWENLTHFDAALQQYGRAIDLAIAIDPANSFAPPGHCRISSNVRTVVLVRSENYYPALPSGREVDHPHVAFRLIFGTNLSAPSDPLIEARVNDPSVRHDNIDANLDTRLLACSRIQNLIGAP